jgi:PAS domain S-box-containing protein
MDQETNTSHAPAAETCQATYFQRLIEKQPAVLMRVALDGAVVAANDAALRLLGAEDLNQLAGLVLPACVAPEHRDRWSEFTAAIAKGTSKACECLFTNLVGTCRQIVFHGVPLLDHHDGILSVILSAHDVSALRRSEEVFENRDWLASHFAKPPEPAEPGRLEQLERLLRDGRQHLLQLRTKLDQEHAEAQSLARALADRDTSLQESIAGQADLSQALAAKEQKCAALEAALAEHQRSSAEDAREHGQREQRSQERLNAITAERDRLAERLDARERQLQTLAEKEQSLEEQLHGALAEHKRVERLLNDHEEQLNTLRAARETLVAERNALQAELDAIQRERSELSVELEETARARQQSEAALANTRAELDALHVGTNQLLPLVSVGRLALEISGELTGVLEAIDTRLESLLARPSLESPTGQDVQLVRADLLIATLLSRELLLSCNRSDSRVTPGAP